MMFKLIPEEKKVQLQSEYSMRRGVLLIFTLITILIVGIVGIFPSFLISNMRNSDVKERIARLQAEPVNEDDQALKVWFESINQKIKYLSPTLDKDQPSTFIEGVIQARNSGIKITSISWTNSNKVTLTINGVASNRQVLIDYQKTLTQSGDYDEVTLPVSNLAKDKNIDFELKVTPKKKK